MHLCLSVCMIYIYLYMYVCIYMYRLVVDTTVAALGRNPKGLWRLSRSTNVTVVMGTGFGVHACHPPWLAAEGQDSVAAMIEHAF
jgi:predicted metal-dependent phosphotriesterase family hydrolase